VSSDKNEILFSEFGINYNNELPQFRKGSVNILSEDQVTRNRKTIESDDRSKKKKSVNESDYSSSDATQTLVLHVDIIKDEFWNQHQYLSDYLET
jgi:tRNA(His) guanylyltransferase